MEITEEGVETIIGVLERAAERLKGTGMPELDVEVRDLIKDLRYFKHNGVKVPVKAKPKK